MLNYFKAATQAKYYRLLCSFCLFIYFYLEAELLFTDRISDKMDVETGTMFYGLFCLAAAAGFFSFFFLRRLSTKSTEQFVIIVLGIAGTVFTLGVHFAGHTALPVLTLLTMYIAGVIGASLLYLMAVKVREKNVIGLFIALPYVLAFILQYALGYITPFFNDVEETIQYVLLAASICGAFILSLEHSELEHNETMIEKSEIAAVKKTEAKKYLHGALLACFLISCLFGLVDGIVMTLHTGQQLDVYGWVRLLCVPGLLFAGWLMDFKEGRFFPFSTLAAFVLLIIALFLFHTEETFNAALGSVYFLGSFMTMYSLGIFVRIAEQSGAATFWASAGRGMKYLMGGVFSLLGSFVFSNFSLILLTSIYLVLLVALFFVFFFQGKLSHNGEETRALNDLQDKSLEEMASGYGFTGREVEVLRHLMLGLQNSEIAEKMNIKENTVYKYVSDMIIRSETKSRSGLIAKFMIPKK